MIDRDKMHAHNCDICHKPAPDGETKLWRNSKGTLVGLYGHPDHIDAEYSRFQKEWDEFVDGEDND